MEGEVVEVSSILACGRVNKATGLKYGALAYCYQMSMVRKIKEEKIGEMIREAYPLQQIKLQQVSCPLKWGERERHTHTLTQADRDT